MRVVHGVLAIVLAGVMIVTVGIMPDSAIAAPANPILGVDYPCSRDGIADAIADNSGVDVVINFDCDSPRIDFYEGDAITISGTLTLYGPSGGDPIILDGNGQTNFFNVEASGSLSLRFMTLQYGEAPLNTDGFYEGGAINNAGDLSISLSAFRENRSSEYGGAISSSGNLDITQSTFIFNHADVHGGALDLSAGKTRISNSTLSGNTAGELGSAISVHPGADLRIRWSTIVQSQGTSPALATSLYVPLPGSAPSNPPSGPTVPEVFAVLFGGYGQHCSLQPGDYLDISESMANDDSCLQGETAHWENQDLWLAPLWQGKSSDAYQSYHPLLAQSSARDATSTCIEGDQLGNGRDTASGCDIGAIDGIYLDSFTLCANRWNGAVIMPRRGDCGRSDLELVIPSYFDSTVCVNNWNGAVRSSTSGDCGRSEHQLTFLGAGSTKVCVNRWNGVLRVSDHCSRSEEHHWL